MCHIAVASSFSAPCLLVLALCFSAASCSRGPATSPSAPTWPPLESAPVCRGLRVADRAPDAGGPPASAAASPTATAARSAIDPPPTEFEPDAGDAPPHLPTVFVEIARVRAEPRVLSDLSRLLSTLRGDVSPELSQSSGSPPLGIEGIRAMSSIHVNAPVDVPTMVRLNPEIGSSPSPACPCGADRKLTITPHLLGGGARVRLEWAEVVSAAWGSQGECPVPDRVLAQTTVVVADQQTVVLGMNPRSETDLEFSILTPYVIDDREGLRRLFECKVQRRRSAR